MFYCTVLVQFISHYFISFLSPSPTVHSMAEDLKTQEENFRQQNKSCFVLGASGESGQMLLKELLYRNIFSKITLIGRRQLSFEDKAHENLVSCAVFLF